jgi:peptidoglycan-N-acetylglucosamine deacetylase
VKNKNYIVFYFIIITTIYLTLLYGPSYENSNISYKSKTYADPISEKPKWGQKDIYLTFDDSPGDRVTEEILNILNKDKIKATFFVVGCRIHGREKILKRITDEGNSIGLHSFTHKIKKIYSNSKVFIEEMMWTSDEIYKVTGLRTNIIRFPGGSKPFMTKKFLEELHTYKFKIYDWNIPVSDGINAKFSPDRFYKEAINQRQFKSPLIILMHCSGENENTVKALPKIIDHYKTLGYEFKTITQDTPEYYFRVKK